MRDKLVISNVCHAMTLIEWIIAWLVAGVVFAVFFAACYWLVERDFRRMEAAFDRREAAFFATLRSASIPTPKGCEGCRFFHGYQGVVCGLHPSGWQDVSPCPDWAEGEVKD
jgi:hypothetical protein